jgi:outer membrane receptor for ferrienterochelin and colicins
MCLSGMLRRGLTIFSHRKDHRRRSPIRLCASTDGSSLATLPKEELMKLSQDSRRAGNGRFRQARARAYCIALLPWIFLATLEGASGQSKDIMDLSPEELKSVQVYSASMYLQSDREAPSAVTVITADQIRQFGYRTLADALRSVRGFDITYDRNYTYVGVRGFSRPGGYNDQVLLLINGHRLNDTIYNSAQLGTEFPLDVDLIERIEIVRGPSSSLYGTSAFLAVINVITKSAQSAAGLELSGEVAGFGSYRGRSTIGGSYHGVEGLFSGTIYDSAGPARLFFPAFDSPATNYGIAQNADRDSSKSFYGSLHFRDFTLSALGSTREKGIPTASFEQVFNDNRSQTTDSTGYVNLQYSRAIFHGTELTAGVYFDRTLYHGVYVDPPAGQETDVLNEDASHGDCFGINARVTRTLWQKHKATFGVDFRDNLRQDQSNYNLNPFQPVLDDQRSSREGAVYGQDEFRIAKGLILNAGLRHDQYQTFGGTTNPRLVLIYSPRPRTTFKLMYGQAFRAPNNYELYYTDHISQGSNPHLRPERIRTEELIWEQDLGANFRISASGFANQFTDLINQETDPQTDLIVFNNSESVHSRGLELELGGKTSSGIEGRVSYALQRTENTSTGLRLAGSPAQLAKANIVFPTARRRLAIGFELQYSDSRKTLAGGQVGSYAISNLTITSREFAKGFRLSGSVYNVFNSPYRDPVGAEIEGSAVQQNGRDFRIQLTHTFRFQ